jgi:hypothetical protein
MATELQEVVVIACVVASLFQGVIMRLAARDKENDDVVFERQADSQSQTGRVSLQRVRRGGEEKEESLQSEGGEGLAYDRS